MSAALRVERDRELLEQRRLQRPHADDEEGAEADGQQHGPRLVAGPAQAQHRVAQRDRSRQRQRPDRADERRRPRGVSTSGHHGQADRHGEADPEATRPASWRSGRARPAGRPSPPTAPSRAPPARRRLAQQQRRLDAPHVEQRHGREQERHQEADGHALHDRGRRHRVRDGWQTGLPGQQPRQRRQAGRGKRRRPARIRPARAAAPARGTPRTPAGSSPRGT